MLHICNIGIFIFVICTRVVSAAGGRSAEKAVQILLHSADAGDAEGICQHLGHVGGEKGRQGGAQVDVFHAQVEQGQQDNHRLLLIPGDVIDDGQVIDVVQAEDLLELEGDDSQGVGVVALARVQHPGDAVDVAQLQLVILVLGASGGEDYRVLGQGLGELGVVIAALGPAVAASHDHELADGTALDGFHHLVGQSQHLVVGKAAHQGALFQLNGGGAAPGVGDQGGKILVSLAVGPDVGAAGKAHCPGGIEPVLVAVLRGHQTVGGQQDGAAEGLELLLLLPPGVAVVAHKVGILLKGGVVVGG